MALLTICDLAQWLTVKPTTLYMWVAQGKIPALKIHGMIRFRHDEIEAWLEGCQIKKSDPPIRATRCPRPSDIDGIIAAAKREVYTPRHGKPDQDRATGKGENDGSV
jgi:excisionase family DNA binding protein